MRRASRSCIGEPSRAGRVAPILRAPPDDGGAMQVDRTGNDGSQVRRERGADLRAAARRAPVDLLVRLLRLLLLYAVLRPLVLLPLSVQLRFGRALGRVGGRLARTQRHNARRNFEICFPGAPPEAIDDLLRRQFEAVGMGIVEMTFGWWAAERRVRERVRVEGLEHYEAARADGRGVIFLTAHFTTMEVAAVALSLHVPGLYGVYRPYDRNPALDIIAREGRGRSAAGLIARDDVKTMVRVLRDGHPLWFANDHLVRPDKRSVLVPFFGEPCVVHGAIVDLVRLSGARVLPMMSTRLPGARCLVEIEPALENFPSDDRAADLARVMGRFEAHIRRDPAQYTWVWRRFGKRQPEYPDLYATPARSVSRRRRS